MAGEAKMEWLMDQSIRPDANMSLARMTVPVDVTSERHFHSNTTETIHVLRGQIEQYIGDKRIVMGPGDTCFIPKAVAHHTRNISSEDAIMMVSYASGTRNYQRA